MKEKQMSEISIDELMEKIKAEVNLRKKEKEASGQPVFRASFDSENAPFQKISGLDLDFFKRTNRVDTGQNKYSINDFLRYYGNDFVENCYRGILKRDPDKGGLHHYLDHLRQGKLTRIEVIGRLRYSKEGKRKGVRVGGLFFPFLLHSSFPIPVLGYLIRLICGMLQLPTLLKNFQNLDAHVHVHFDAIKDHLNQTGAAIQTGVNRIIDVYGYSLNTLANGKTDRDEVEKLLSEKADRDEVEKLLSEKADRDEVEKLLSEKADRDEVEKLLSEKADLDEVEGWLNQKADSILLDQLAGEKIDRDVVEKLLLKKTDHDVMERLISAKADRDEVQGWLTEKSDLVAVQKLENCKADKNDLDMFTNLKTDKVETERIYRQVLDHKRNILDQDRRLRLLLAEARKRFPDPITTSQLEKMVNEEAHFYDAMYASFEDQFRGTRDDIKNRQLIYLSYLKEAELGTTDSPIIDIGCGRGEWLELLKENGFIAKGVEINRVLANECWDLGLTVTLGEGVGFLRQEKRETYGAVTAFQLVEHLPLDTLIELLDESFRVLRPGGIIVFETPNPDNILVGCRNFYIDPTHERPIPSPTLQAVAEARGFANTQVIPLHAVPEIERDQSIGKTLSEMLYGPQDYAILGYKG